VGINIKEPLTGMSTVDTNAKLIKLGERALEMALYRQIEAARKRRILRVVYSHLNASDRELKDRLNEAMTGNHEPTPNQREALLNKLVP